MTEAFCLCSIIEYPEKNMKRKYILPLIPTLIELVIKGGIESMPDEAFPRQVRGTGGRVELRKHHNPGFPLGALKEHPMLVKHVPLSVTGILAAQLLWLTGQKKKPIRRAGLSLLVAGSAGNLFDRLFRGYVVDYIYVGAGPLKKIVFNLSDVLIAGGGILAVISAAAEQDKAAGMK